MLPMECSIITAAFGDKFVVGMVYYHFAELSLSMLIRFMYEKCIFQVLLVSMITIGK